MTESQVQHWCNQPEIDDLVIEGVTEGRGQLLLCVVSLYAVRDGQLACLRRQCSVNLLPWEKQANGERRALRLLVHQLLAEHFKIQKSPWGILRGIRPTKIVHRLLDTGFDTAFIQGFLHREYDVELIRAKLVTDIAIKQRTFLLTTEQARKVVSIYIGIPFCPSRCLYCSFPAFPIAGAGQQVDRFIDALRHEMWAVQEFLAERHIGVQTIYIGGGTPTSLPDSLFRRLLDDVDQLFTGVELREYTVEAGRPDTITEDKLSIMREYGVGRISINPQSMREHTLLAIGRYHRPEDVEHAFLLARQFDFHTINMDIIAGLPGETPNDMTYTLERIAALRPDNLTVHTLAVKRGSGLKERSGFERTGAGTVRAMLVNCALAAQDLGMSPYYLYRQKYMAGNMENVGYALPGKECLYNIQIMEERQTILGLGAAATTKAVYPDNWQLESCHNPKDVSTYIKGYQACLERKLALVDRVLMRRN
jgi:oxygen-independent coproporphyrinogen-3 oxidase